MSVNRKRPWPRAVAFCLLMLTGQYAAAEVYTYIDANGNRVFTDQPHKNAKKVEVAPSNQIRSTPRKAAQASSAKPRPGPLFRYQLLRILAPEPDATIRDVQGNLIATVTNDPELQSGHTYRLLLDGNIVAQSGRSPVIPLSNIDRGTHQLSIEIVDEFGRVVERTPNQPFHMMRISLAQKRLAQPCKTEDYGARPECALKDKPAEESSILPLF